MKKGIKRHLTNSKSLGPKNLRKLVKRYFFIAVFALVDDPNLIADYKISNVKVVSNSYQYGPSSCPGARHIKLWQNVTEVTIDNLYNVTRTVRTINTCGS